MLTSCPGKYCCPSDTPIHDCTWRGSRYDCPDAKCKSDEVAIRNDQQGNSIWTCSCECLDYLASVILNLTCRTGGRKKTDCCKVTKPPPPSLKCNVTTCDLDPGLCEIAADSGYTKRDIQEHTFEKRGPKRPYEWPLYGWTIGSGLTQVMRSRSYPDPSGYMRNLRHRMAGLAGRWWYMRSENCGRPDLRAQQLSSNDGAPRGAEVEHPIPV